MTMTYDETDISVCTDPFMFGENGHFAITDGFFVWTVVVTEEAMKATSSPPTASLDRLRRGLRLYVAIARAALAERRPGSDKIWILEDDVRAFRRLHQRQSFRRIPQPVPATASRSGSAR
jgi:hypothetical protein